MIPLGDDVLQDHHRIVDQHADSEGHAGEADHVERPAKERECEEGSDNADRNGNGGHQGAPQAPQKQQQHADRQHATDHNVAADEADRRVDVVGLVIDLRQRQPAFSKHALIDVAGHLPQFGHRLKHVGVLVAGDTDGDVARSEAADDAVGLAGAQAGIGDVPDIDRPTFSTSDDHRLNLLR